MAEAAAQKATFRAKLEARRAKLAGAVQHQQLLARTGEFAGDGDGKEALALAQQAANAASQYDGARVAHMEQEHTQRLEARQRQLTEEREVMRQREEQFALQADLQARAENETLTKHSQGVTAQEENEVAAAEEEGLKEAVVLRVLKNRHLRLRTVLKQQYEEKKQLAAKEALDVFTEQRMAERNAMLSAHELALTALALQEKTSRGSTNKMECALVVRDQRQELASFDRKTQSLQTHAVKDAVVPLELKHGQAELRLRDVQYNDVSRTFKQLSLKGVMVAQVAEKRKR